MNSISHETENNILSYLKTKDYKYINKRFNDYSNNVENEASCVITRFLQKVIAEKKAMLYILNYKNGCKINATVCKQYIVKFYPDNIKQNALQYYLNMISRERVSMRRQCYIHRGNQNVVDMEMARDFAHGIIMVTIMIPDTSSKIRWIVDSFCQYKENNALMFDMYDYFLRYKVMNQ